MYVFIYLQGEMIQLLVQYGADLDATTNNNETPLSKSDIDIYYHTHTHKLVNTGKRGPPIVPLLFIL